MLKLHKAVLESGKRYYMPINCQSAYQPIATRIDLAKQRHGCKQQSIRNELVHTRHGQFLRS